MQTAVGTAAQKVALLKQKQEEANKAFEKGDLSAAEYKKIELSVLRAQNQLQGLNNENRQNAEDEHTTSIGTIR
ncbi:MAG: hypothetical protein ACOX2Y_03035 [Christensenellales bacterium]